MTTHCEVCGALIAPARRCTNGRCPSCHARWCTPGGNDAPGHARMYPPRSGLELADTARYYTLAAFTIRINIPTTWTAADAEHALDLIPDLTVPVRAAVRRVLGQIVAVDGRPDDAELIDSLRVEVTK